MRARDLVVVELVAGDQLPAAVVGASATLSSGDLTEELLEACGQPDGAGEVQTHSDSVQEVVDDLGPVAIPPVEPPIRHRVRMDWGARADLSVIVGVFLENTASGMQGYSCIVIID